MFASSSGSTQQAASSSFVNPVSDNETFCLLRINSDITQTKINSSYHSQFMVELNDDLTVGESKFSLPASDKPDGLKAGQ